MSKISAILVLSAILLAQYYQPTEAQEVGESGEKDNSYLLLLVSVMQDIEPISKQSIAHGTLLFKKVLEDVSVLKHPSEALQADITELTDFLTAAAAKEHAKPEADKEVVDAEIFELGAKFWEIIEKYNTTALEKPTIEDLLIEMSLYKNGYAQFESVYEKQFLELLEKFYAKVDEYIAKVTPAEREERKNFIEVWYPAFKSEHDFDKKEKLFEELIEDATKDKE